MTTPTTLESTQSTPTPPKPGQPKQGLPGTGEDDSRTLSAIAGMIFLVGLVLLIRSKDSSDEKD